MKTQQNIFTKLILILFVISIITSCKKDDKVIDDNTTTTDENTITKKYYIKAKFDNEWKVAQTNTPAEIQTTGVIEYTAFTDLYAEEGMTIDISNENYYGAYFINDKTTELKGDTLYFNSNGIKPSFSVDLDGVYYSTYYSSYYNIDQNDSYMYISDVISDGTSYFGCAAYLVKGTFKCKVTNSEGNKTVIVTEGIFAGKFVNEEDGYKK